MVSIAEFWVITKCFQLDIISTAKSSLFRSNLHIFTIFGFFSISSKLSVNVFVGSFVCLLLSNVRIVKMNEKANERKYSSFHTISRFVYISCFGSTRGQQNKADQYLRWHLVLHCIFTWNAKKAQTHTERDTHMGNVLRNP